MSVPSEEGKPVETGGDQLPRSARSAARLAAVQALYQMEMTGCALDTVIAEFLAHRFGTEIDGVTYNQPDKEFFVDAIKGVVREQRPIDRHINAALTENWSLRRLESILRAILRAATYELMSRPDVPAKVIINEYVDIAHAFFENDEPAFVNGVLDRLSKELRADPESPQGSS